MTLRVVEGDRAAFYETSQWTIKQNKDTLAALKKQNKELRAQVSGLQTVRLLFLVFFSNSNLDALIRARRSLGCGVGTRNDAGAVIKVSNQVISIAVSNTSHRKDCDDLKHQSSAREGLLTKLQDQVQEMSSTPASREEDDSPLVQVRLVIVLVVFCLLCSWMHVRCVSRAPAGDSCVGE